MSTTKNDRLVRAKEAARMLGVSHSKFWDYWKNGKIPQGVKMSPRVRVWRMRDLQAHIDKLFQEDNGAPGSS